MKRIMPLLTLMLLPAFIPTGHAASFPEELAAVARRHQCSPVMADEDASESRQFYAYGYAASGNEKDSAVFWCKSDTVTTKPYRLVFMFKDPALDTDGCPNVIQWQHDPINLEIVSAGTGPGKHLYTYAEERSLEAPTEARPKGIALTNSKNELIYCHDGSWFARYTVPPPPPILTETAAIANVRAYIKLLTQPNPPTLAELERHGRGDLHGEVEVTFLLMKCRKMGWGERGADCISFERSRWKSATKSPSLYLGWLRSRFSTVNAPTKIIRTWKDGSGWKNGNNERFFYAEVRVGKNTFVTFDSASPPGGMGFEKVNGKSVFNIVRAYTGVRFDR